MIQVWLFALRAAVASAYMTLVLANREAASQTLVPFTVLVTLVAVHDLFRFYRRT